MPSRRTLISAYGVPSDREKLDALARAVGKSSSSWIIQKIREEYARTFQVGGVGMEPDKTLLADDQ